MRLADFIQAKKEPILQLWEEFARTLAPAQPVLSSKELRNHGAELLEAIATDMRTPQTGDEQAEKSKGKGPYGPEDVVGAEHGSTRLGAGFSIEQVVAEYRALRASVFRLWAESQPEIGPIAAEEVTRFNEAIDQLLAASVGRFAKESREALEEKQRRKDYFLATLAHELRNPLAPIAAGAALLKAHANDEERVNRVSEIIGRQASYLSGLLDDLLDISRITRGVIELQTEPQDMEQVIADAVEQVGPVVQARGHQLTVRPSPGQAIVAGDRKRLVQVVANLLHNAAKYTPPGGRITLAVEVQPDSLTVTVEDNGVGMVPGLVASAFEPFSQGRPAIGQLTEGLGLGLAVVKRLVELHGGEVSCSSGGPHRGSRFTVSLPRLVYSQPGLGARYVDTHVAAEQMPLKIMIVDDNTDAAESLGMLLNARGYQIHIENRPENALAMARTLLPDVCLLDIGMPGIGGNELARELRRQPDTANLLLVAVTGFGQEGHIEESRAAGFDHHLTKPVNMQLLLDVLAAHRPAG